ncbi:hypothetical protein HPT25_23045 [Bacillus sp. BRMEA1]|uniref:hypothetical protein n=1 Tax=Neobacillus endophyticus TaxID=2738405 RepID=UPI001565484A|nr:hypothetical protein [Neobacillus endophyticus]NRD80211.1 hypothetical protein [Neobacillus endophyticus]
MKHYITIQIENDYIIENQLRDFRMYSYSFPGSWLFYREETYIEIDGYAKIRLFLSVALFENGIGIYLFDEDKDGNVYTGDWYEYPDLESAILCKELPLEVSLRLKEQRNK